MLLSCLMLFDVVAFWAAIISSLQLDRWLLSSRLSLESIWGNPP